ncbi:uncharacterized protein [Halyomorpha halys]|uniref:uncharacterized protein isoform X1 n=1 Tax=Halyomorpha halys TaxID=286706 RepID=UPI0006D51571|nr:uncharacterized protein LOC106687700 isoform X1 [Halyomorpha halys]XP_014287212.1 uncharacterized protein LOC106687700 isoform X1 [Halyomorpha halys]
MGKKLVIKCKKRIRKFKSKSDGEAKDTIYYSESFPRCKSEGKDYEILDLGSEEDVETPKEVLEETSTRIAYSLEKYVEPQYRLQLSTFRPLSCPMPSCNLSLCPSALLIHLQQCHRDLPSSELELSGNISTFDIYGRLCQLEALEPTPIHLFKVNDGMYPEFPVLLHMCWLSEQEMPALTSERWLAAWLSSLYIVPMWFRLQFVAYSPTQTAITYVCKATETKIKMSPNEIAESINVMLVQEKSLARLYSNELSLYVEVNTYNSKPRSDYS